VTTPARHTCYTATTLPHITLTLLYGTQKCVELPTALRRIGLSCIYHVYLQEVNYCTTVYSTSRITCRIHWSAHPSHLPLNARILPRAALCLPLYLKAAYPPPRAAELATISMLKTATPAYQVSVHPITRDITCACISMLRYAS
jgi:hypothetical protein